MGSANVTLYAVWTHTYNVTYDPNGSTGGSVPIDANYYSPGALVNVMGNPGSLVRTSFVFAGWNTQANGSGTTYTQGQSFTMGSANMTLYAAWIPTYSVTYNANGSTGGSVPTDSNHYLQGATVTVLGAGSLINTGYAFAGWTASTTGVAGASYSIGSTFTMGSANVNLYAVWIPTDLTFTSSGTNIAITGYTTTPTGSLTIPVGVTEHW